jgi:hypothetical protein
VAQGGSLRENLALIVCGAGKGQPPCRASGGEPAECAALAESLSGPGETPVHGIRPSGTLIVTFDRLRILSLVWAMTGARVR